MASLSISRVMLTEANRPTPQKSISALFPLSVPATPHEIPRTHEMSLRLYANNGSPFALKAIILSRELALFPRITIDYSVAPSPIALTTSHSNQVPHGKIPALIVDEKSALFGSEVICAYFLEIAEKKPAAPGTFGEFSRLERC